MNLIVDIGNTNTKVAQCDNGEVITFDCYDDFAEEIFNSYTAQCPVIVSSTKILPKEFLQSRFEKILVFDHKTPIPIKNLYDTPETLGMDRLAAAVGAWEQAPESEILIFDFGTAITIDRVSKRGEYLGGAIAPGMGMRFAALHHFTDRLPLVGAGELAGQGDSGVFTSKVVVDNNTKACPLAHLLPPPKNTTAAILHGVIKGIEHEINGYIEEISPEKIFFTGGDAKYFVNSAKKPIFADYHLVIKGLDRILNYNA